jgi:Tol biopolymer transport system component/DNA-binding winged helix-turn-helix (wHTH) protein
LDLVSPAYRFGPYEIHTRTRELFKCGTKLKVRPQPFLVLQVLVEHGGDVVTREELKQLLWPAETFVDFEHGLNTSIKELRQILSDSARQPRYIETLPKLGYRIVAPVEAEPANHIPSNGDVRPDSTEEPPQLALRPRRDWLYVSLAIFFAAVLAGSIVIQRQSEPENSMPEPLTSFPGVEHGAAWSPDGGQVAFMWSGEKQEQFDIYLMQPGSSHTLRLTTEPGENCCPAWSPDGRWIAYTHGEPGSRRTSLRLVSPIGGPVRTVLTNPEGIGRPSWTPDGRALVIEIIPAPKQPAALWAVWVDTGRRRQLTAPPDGIEGDTAPAVSPDGKTLAFCRATMWRTAELYLMNLKSDLSPAEVPRRSTDLGFVGVPAWTPDGSRIVFETHEGAGLFQMDRGGRNPRPIPNVPAHVGSPALVRRPGGYTSLVFDSSTAKTSIWRYSAEAGNGGAPVELAPSSRSQGTPRYSHDGNRLAFNSDRTGHQEIWVANADGSQPVQLTDLRHILTEAPDWSPSDDLIAFVSQDRANRQIYLASTSGGQATAITHEEGVRSGDGWSLDGSAYYYTSTRSGRAEVWRVPRGGGPSQQVTRDGGICGFESPRGIFYYWKGESGNRGALFRRTAQGEQPALIAAEGVSCRTSPSPKGFYFRSADRSEVYLYDEAAGSSVRVPQRPDRSFSRFTMSPDGDWLAINFNGKESKDLMIMEHFR